MFRVKICGVTTVADALAVATAGASAIGLNFYSQSPRYCSPAAAADICRTLPPEVCRVGVFVNATTEEVRDRFHSLSLDMVQIHGDEPPDFLASLRGLPIVRAFRPQQSLLPVREYLTSCHRLRCSPRMVLIDAKTAGEYGGSGQLANWKLIVAERAHLQGTPLILAGGLTPINVLEAIRTVRPWGVDTASGVEESPGRKSAKRIAQFVSIAKSAFSGRSNEV
jgi:phosphoribosylanthranilate isomerase